MTLSFGSARRRDLSRDEEIRSCWLVAVLESFGGQREIQEAKGGGILLQLVQINSISVQKRTFKRCMAKTSSSAETFMKELECAICLVQYKEPIKSAPMSSLLLQNMSRGTATQRRTGVESRLSIVHEQCRELERSNFGCDSCDNVDAAINRCATCRQFLCDICTAAHKRGRGTKTHRVMSLEEAREEGPIAVVHPSFCKEHEGEMPKLFCETCDEAVCRDCTIIKHRDHKCTFIKDTFGKEKDINLSRKFCQKQKRN
ncbi:hypothetical protein ACROYT_G038518 [Oculina patagonica]